MKNLITQVQLKCLLATGCHTYTTTWVPTKLAIVGGTVRIENELWSIVEVYKNSTKENDGSESVYNKPKLGSLQKD